MSASILGARWFSVSVFFAFAVSIVTLGGIRWRYSAQEQVQAQRRRAAAAPTNRIGLGRIPELRVLAILEEMALVVDRGRAGFLAHTSRPQASSARRRRYHNLIVQDLSPMGRALFTGCPADPPYSISCGSSYTVVRDASGVDGTDIVRGCTDLGDGICTIPNPCP